MNTKKKSLSFTGAYRYRCDADMRETPERFIRKQKGQLIFVDFVKKKLIK